MTTNFQIVDSDLAKLKTSLQGISSSLSSLSPSEKRKFEKSSSSDTLSAGLTSLSGTLSSEQARRSVASAKTSSPGTTSTPDPLNQALQAKVQAEARAREAEAKKKEAEATASIADQRLMQGKTKAGTSSTPSLGDVPIKGAVELRSILETEPLLADYGLTEENVQDPMVIATLRNQVATSNQLEQDAVRLNEMVEKKEERTKQQVALIGQSVKNQTEQLKVEQRKRMAAEGMASVLSGRSLYSPEEHQGLIQEVVQDGILKLQEIQLEGYKLQNEMWDNFENYEFEAYTKKSEILKEYNKLELDTVTAVQTRLQTIAKTAQEKMVFDQTQMDRNSLILAEELVGASDAAIRQTATEQGIDYGLLKRAVADATDVHDTRAFNKEDRALSLTEKRLSIATSQKALSNSTKGFTQQELDDIDTYASEWIKEGDDFNITIVPSSGGMRAAVIAQRNALQGEKDMADFLETGGTSFTDWLNEDKTRTKFVKSEFAYKGNYSSWFTPKGMDITRAINSKEGQTAVQIAIEQGAKSNENIYKALFGTNGIIIEHINEKAKAKSEKEDNSQKSANSSSAFAR